jgi:hypothetical protein
MLWLVLGRMRGSPRAKAIFISISAKRRTGLDKTVSAPTLSSRTVEEWIEEFRRLKKLNQQLFVESDKVQSSILKATKGRRMKATQS